MKVGIGLRSVENAIDHSVRAEKAGFDYVFCGEHLFFHGPVPNAFAMMGVAAGATERVELLTAVTLLPFYPAVLTAKMASVLQIASGGRFNLGVGIGGEFPAEFEAAGIPHAERAARAAESLEVIRKLFHEGQVTYDGKWAKLDGLALNPGLAERGAPLIWAGGRGAGAQRRAAKWADVWMPYMYTPEQLSESLASVREQAETYDRDPASIAGGIYAFISVHRDGKKAEQMAIDTVGSTYKQDFSTLARYLITGTPEQCVARLRAYRDAGAVSAQLQMACTEEAEAEMFSLLAEEVLPAAQRL